VTKKDGEEDKEDESLEMPAVETQPEMSYEGKKDMMAGKKMDQKDMKEYKNPVTANHSDASDKSAKSPVAAKGGSSSGASGSNLNQGQADSGTSGASTSINGSSTPQKMAGEFENTGGKAKSTSFKKQEKANTADGSDKSAKSPVASK
jgi:general stress protein YciG